MPSRVATSRTDSPLATSSAAARPVSHHLVQRWQAAGVGMGAFQGRYVSEPLTIFTSDDYAIRTVAHRSHPFPNAASRSRSMLSGTQRARPDGFKTGRGLRCRWLGRSKFTCGVLRVCI
jgi:hypothetical protein